MASFHPSELDSCCATDSIASSPRSEHHVSHDPRVRFMCSFGGKILPRPHDNQLRYVGGDTRIVAVHRSTTFSTLITKLSKLSGIANVSVKYQLPNEDLDALISITTDEDVENMMDEYDRVSHQLNPRVARLRLFLFTTGEDSRASSISSILSGSLNRENWFFDALNSGSRLQRLRSEASSIVSEVPDYLFGLENSDESQSQPLDPKMKGKPSILHDNVSASDPGSPATVVSSSPFCSTSSAVPTVPSIPDFPLLKTKFDNPDPIMPLKQSTTPAESFSETIEPPPPAAPPMTQSTGYPGNPVMHYIPDSHYSVPPPQQIPVYYVQGPAPPGNAPIQPIENWAPYGHQYSVPTGQVPVGYQQPVPGLGQVYGGPVMRPPYDAGRVMPDGMYQHAQHQQVYYGIRNASGGMVPGNPTVVVSGGEDLQRTVVDPKTGRISQSTT